MTKNAVKNEAKKASRINWECPYCGHEKRPIFEGEISCCFDLETIGAFVYGDGDDTEPADAIYLSPKITVAIANYSIPMLDIRIDSDEIIGMPIDTVRIYNCPKCGREL